MSDPLMLRPVMAEEARALKRLARSQTTEARLRDRARLCWLSHRGQRVSQIVGEVGLSDWTVRKWLKRFNQRGLDGLHDRARAGRPPTYTPAEVGAVDAAEVPGEFRLQTPVRAVRQCGPLVTVETACGVLSARVCILAMPVNVIGHIAFGRATARLASQLLAA